MPRLLSVNVGLPREVHMERQDGPNLAFGNLQSRDDGWCASSTLTAMRKPILPVTAASIALCSFIRWTRITTGSAFSSRNDFPYGQFGENFTVEGLPDNEVCIGDRYRIGDAVFEVTPPRVTCYRVGIRMNEPRMPALLVAHHRPGFYFRVLQEGEVGCGRRDRKGCRWSGTDHGRGHRCAAVFARTFSRATGTSAPHSCTQQWLANFFPDDA